MFPGFEFEEWFAEEDELWNPEVREQPAERNVRLGEALKDIFRHDKSTYITISAHSGAITSMLAAIGHRPFGLQTGGVIPVVVKVRKVYKHDQTQEVLE